jgi:DNA polymerase-3 subunit alpha
LKTLTSIQKAVDAIEQSTQVKIDWVNLPLADVTTFELLNQGKTQGIFQLESTGMQELAKQLHIDKFEEIIAVGALYRPGPMEMIPTFINRKHGREKIEIDHPWMADILSETYGIIVYQEQVMQIASKLANYSLGDGDVLRRARRVGERLVVEPPRGLGEVEHEAERLPVAGVDAVAGPRARQVRRRRRQRRRRRVVRRRWC